MHENPPPVLGKPVTRRPRSVDFLISALGLIVLLLGLTLGVRIVSLMAGQAIPPVVHEWRCDLSGFAPALELPMECEVGPVRQTESPQKQRPYDSGPLYLSYLAR